MGLTALALLTAALTIRAEYTGPAWQVYLFKPVTMLLIIRLAARQPNPPGRPHVRRAILMGLLFSLGGDILLMLPQDLFIWGLLSFLIAHLWYIRAFWSGARTWQPWLLLAAYGAVVFIWLRPGLGALQLPVLLYMGAILTMLWQAWQQYRAGRPGAAWALAGAALFVLSDTLLAFNRFNTPFDAARLAILSTYFTAQWLIAASLRPRPADAPTPAVIA